MTKQELKELISEAVKEQLDIVDESTDMDEIALAEAEVETALATESACFAYLESVSIMEAAILEYNHDTYTDGTQTDMASKFIQRQQAAQADANLVNQALADLKKDGDMRVTVITDVEKGAISKDSGTYKVAQANAKRAREAAAKKVAQEVNKKSGKKILKAVGDKIISVYSGKDGKGKQFAAIAGTATAVAGSIAAVAIRNAKKKAKEENEKADKK